MTSFTKCPPAGHFGFLISGLCRWHDFRSITRVCFIPLNFMCMSFVAVSRSPWIFSGHIQNGYMVAILDFLVSECLNLVKLWIPSPNFSSTLLVCPGRILMIYNDVQLQSTYCPLLPPPTGCGYLFDHWSTISSYIIFCIVSIEIHSLISKQFWIDLLIDFWCKTHQLTFQSTISLFVWTDTLIMQHTLIVLLLQCVCRMCRQ